MKGEYGMGGGAKKDHVILNANTCSYLPDAPCSQ